MPHIHLTSTADVYENVEIGDILGHLVADLAALESISANSIKAYHSLISLWAVGEGHRPGFIHCQIHLMEGRDHVLKGRIADAMHASLKREFHYSDEQAEAAITLEITEIARVGYRK